MNKMKNNYILSIFFLISICFLTGCAQEKESLVYNRYLDEENIDGYNIKIDYDFSQAEKDGFVTYYEDEVVNEDKIEEFYEKTSNNEDAILTMIKYNNAQEEIILEYVYKDETYTLYIDNTRVQDTEGKITKRIIKDIEIGYNSKGQKIIIEKY